MNSELDLKGALYTSTDIYNKVMAQANCTQDEFNEIMNFHNSQDEIEFDRELNNRKRRVNVGLRTKEISADQLSNDFESVNNWLFLLKNQSQFLHETEQIDKSIKDPDANVSSGETVENNALNLYSFQTSLVRQLRKIIETKESPTTARLVELYTTASNNLKLREEVHFRLSRNLDEANRKLIESSTENEELTDMINDLDKKLEGFKDQKNYEEIQKAKKYNIIQHVYQKNKKDLLKQIDLAETEINGYKIKEKTEVKLLIQLRHNEEDASKLIIAYQDKIIQMESDIKSNEASYKQLLLTLEKELKSRRTGQVAGEKRQTSDIKKKMTSNSSKELTTFKKSSTSNNKQTEKDLKKYDGSDDKSVENAIQYLDNYQETTIKQTKEIFDKEIKELQQILADEQSNIQMECNQLYNEKVSNITKERDMELSNKYRLKGLLNDREIELKSVSQQLEIYEGILSDVTHEYKTTKKANKEKKQQLTGNEKQKWEKRKLMKASIKSIDYFIDKANFIIDLFKKKLKERMDKAISTEYPFKTGSKTDIKKRSLKEKVKRSNSMLFGKEKDEKLGIDPFVRIKNYNYERDDLRMSVRFTPSFTPKQPSNVTFQAGVNQPKVGRRMSKITSSTNIANHPVNRRMSTFTGTRAKLGQNNPDIQSKIKKQHSIDLETFHEMNSNKNEFQNKINKQQSVDFKSLRSNTNNNTGESFPTMRPNLNSNENESFPTMKPNINSNENESFPTMKQNINNNGGESFPTMKPNTNSNENESFPTMKPNTNNNEGESFPTMRPNINSNGGESFPTMRPNTNSNESESFPTMKANTSSNGGESFPTMKPNINSNVRESFPAMKPNTSTNDSESFPTMKPSANNNESSFPQLSISQSGNDDSESKITFPNIAEKAGILTRNQISEIERNGNEIQLKEKLENTVVNNDIQKTKNSDESKSEPKQNKISPSNSNADENSTKQTKISPTISKATDPLNKETKDDDEATDSFKNNNIQKNETQTVSEEKVADSSADSGKEKAVYINDTDDDVSKITPSSSKTDQNGVVNKVVNDSKQVKIAPSSSKTDADDSPKQSKLSSSNSQSNEYTNAEKNSASNSNTYNSTTIDEISPSNSKTNDNSSKQNKVSQSNIKSNDLTNNEKNSDSDSKTDSDTVNQNKITPSNSKTDDKHSNQKVTQNPVETTSQPNIMIDASPNIECKENDDIKINTTSITKNSLKNEKQEETETTEPDANSITNAELDRVSNENQNDQTSNQINPTQPSEIKTKDDEITDSIQQEENNAIQSENNQTKPIQIHQQQIKNDNETSATPKSNSQQQNEIKPIQIHQPQTKNFNETSATPETNSQPTSETKPIQIHQPQFKDSNETSATPETDFQLQNEDQPIQIHHPQTKNDNATSITPETDSQPQNEAIQHYESSDPNPTQNETDTSTTDHTSPITTKHDSSPSTITPQSSTDSQTRHEERGIQPDPVKSLPTILNDEDIKLVRAPMILKGKNTRHRVTITNKNATKSSDAENETQEPTKKNKTMKEDSIVTVTQPPEDNTKTKTTKSTKETKSTNKVDTRSIMPTFDIRVFKSVGGRFVNTNLCYDPEEDFVDIKTGQICHKYRHWNGTSASFDPELDFYDDSGILHHIYKVSLKNIHKNKNKNKQNPELELNDNDNDNEKVESVPPIPIQTINSNKKPRHKSATTSVSNSSSFFTPTRKRNDDENQILPHQYLMPIPNSLGISPLTYRKRISNSPPQRPLYYSMKSNKPDSIENNDSLHVTPMNDKISTRSQESFSSKSLRVFADQKDTETPKSARCFRSKKKGELIDKNMIDTEPLLPPLSPNGSSVKKLDQSVTISNQEVPLPRVPKVTQLTENDGMSVTPRRLNFHNKMPNSDPLGENTSPRRNRASRDLNFMRGSMDLSSRKNGRIVDVKTLSPRMKKSNQVSNSQPNMVSNENNENSI